MSSHRESETVLPGRRPATSACLAKSACGPYSYAHLSFRHLVDCIASENKSSVQLQTTGHRTDGNRDPGNNHRNPQHSHKELSLLAKSGVAVEKVHFSQNSRNLGDRKCLSDPRKSIVGLPDAILFLRISWTRVLQQPQALSLIENCSQTGE